MIILKSKNRKDFASVAHGVLWRVLAHPITVHGLL